MLGNCHGITSKTSPRRRRRWSKIQQKLHPQRIGVVKGFFSVLVVCLGCLLQPSGAIAQVADWPDESTCRNNPPLDDVKKGWCLSIDREKGNCIACHTFNINPWPRDVPVAGNIAPPLVAMQPRFPDLEALRKQVADAPAVNPRTTMPPYLRHELLNADEIGRILQFLLTL